MKRFDSPMLKVFFCGLPAIAVLAVFCHFYSSAGLGHERTGYRLLNDFSGLMIALWMALSIYLSVRLVISGPFRDHVMAKLTFMRERDEREVMLTGRATRTTFLTSLALLIFLFCLSCFQVSIYRVAPERAVEGKTGFVSLGLSFDLAAHPRKAVSQAGTVKDIFSYTGLPVSTSAVILLLIIWQIVSYNLSMRRMTD